MSRRTSLLAISAVIFILLTLGASVVAQDSATVLSPEDASRVVQLGFYFQGLSAATQMRIAAAACFGSKRYVMVGMVDASGYAADVRAKSEGFFITDSPIKINGS